MGLPCLKPPLSIQHQRFSRQGSVAKPFTVALILFLVFLLPLGATQNNGITLYDDANLDANENNITGLDTLNFSSAGQARILNFFDQDRCADDEAIKTIYPNGSYICNSINETTAAEGLPDTLEQNRTATLDIDALRNALVSSKGGVRLGDGQGSVNTRGGLQVSGRYDVATARSDGSFDVSGRDSRPLGLDWNNDGSKLYFVGDGGNSIYEYTASTAFDASTASFSTSLDVSGQDSVPTGIAWSGDGSKLFMVGRSNANVYEYSASAPFDLSSVSFADSFDVSPQDGTPRGISVSGDGTKLIVGGDGTETVYGYSLSTSNDVSTASLSGSHDVSSEEANARGVAWGAEGTRMFVAGENSGSVYEYTVSTPYSVDTAEFDESYSVSSEDSEPSGLAWDSNGSQLYVSGNSNNKIQQYQLASGDTDFRGGSLENSIGNLSVADNLSIEGDLNLTGDSLYNFFNQSGCSGGRVIDQIYPDGSYSCISVDSVSSVEGLPETLNENNTANQEIDLDQNNISNLANLENFFDQTKCADDEAIKTVYPNGSYKCNSISTTTEAEGLPETLAVNDTANQSIEMDGNDVNNVGSISTQGPIIIGNPAGFSDSEDVIIGENAEVETSYSDYPAVSVGQNALAGASSIAIGEHANSTSYDSVSIGFNSDATASSTTVIGAGSEASGTYAAAFGHESTAAAGSAAAFGDDSTASGEHASAVGSNSEASGGSAAAFGESSEASAEFASAFGYLSEASGEHASAVGSLSEASGEHASAVGSNSEASADGAVAIGHFANAPNQYEATFGNLGSEQLDLNVTGNATIHGEDLDLRNGDIENFFDQTKCADDEAIKTVYPNGSYECNTISTDQSVEGLPQTLAADNTLNDSLDLASGQAIEIGSGTSASIAEHIAIGRGAEALGDGGFGPYGSTAIGHGATADGTSGLTAVGHDSTASDSWTSAFGQDATASDTYASAFGSHSEASGESAAAFGREATASAASASVFGSHSEASVDSASAFGASSEASAEGAVAIGHEAVAPNTYEATFGNLDDDQLDVNVTGNLTVHGDDLDLRNGDIENFFDQTQCADDEAIKTVYPNGSYECNSISTTTEAEGLPATLAVDNTLNDSLELASGQAVEIGTSLTTNEPEDVAIGRSTDASGAENVFGDPLPATAVGYQATATGESASAFGYASEASGGSASAFGRASVASGGSASAFGSTSEASGNDAAAFGVFSVASGNDASAFGRSSVASGSYASAFGTASEASAEGAVAIGREAIAPNSYEATFGNLDGEELDVNVTGNLTVHGQDLDLRDGDIENFFDQTQCADDEAIKTVYPNGSYECNTISQTTQTEGLSETLSAGNVMNQSIDLASGQAIEIGTSLTTERSDDVAIGRSTTATGGTLLGDPAPATAVGRDATASGGSASAFGYDSEASANYASAFGLGSEASGASASAFGRGSEASALGAVAIGYNSVADESYTVEIGSEAQSYNLKVNGGSITATGSKNFVHEINGSHEAVYTSQESPDARAVYEGNASVEAGETKVDLPSHFKQVVSDSRPELRVQVTPIGRDAMPVRVFNKSQNGFVVEQAVGDPGSFSFDYRITGIRDGYEDKQAVREN